MESRHCVRASQKRVILLIRTNLIRGSNAKIRYRVCWILQDWGSLISDSQLSLLTADLYSRMPCSGAPPWATLSKYQTLNSKGIFELLHSYLRRSRPNQKGDPAECRHRTSTAFQYRTVCSCSSRLTNTYQYFRCPVSRRPCWGNILAADDWWRPYVNP